MSKVNLSAVMQYQLNAALYPKQRTPRQTVEYGGSRVLVATTVPHGRKNTETYVGFVWMQLAHLKHVLENDDRMVALLLLMGMPPFCHLTVSIDEFCKLTETRSCAVGPPTTDDFEPANQDPEKASPPQQVIFLTPMMWLETLVFKRNLHAMGYLDWDLIPELHLLGGTRMPALLVTLFHHIKPTLKRPELELAFGVVKSRAAQRGIEEPLARSLIYVQLPEDGDFILEKCRENYGFRGSAQHRVHSLIREQLNEGLVDRKELLGIVFDYVMSRRRLKFGENCAGDVDPFVQRIWDADHVTRFAKRVTPACLDSVMCRCVAKAKGMPRKAQRRRVLGKCQAARKLGNSCARYEAIEASERLVKQQRIDVGGSRDLWPVAEPWKHLFDTALIIAGQNSEFAVLSINCEDVTVLPLDTLLELKQKEEKEEKDRLQWLDEEDKKMRARNKRKRKRQAKRERERLLREEQKFKLEEQKRMKEMERKRKEEERERKKLEAREARLREEMAQRERLEKEKADRDAETRRIRWFKKKEQAERRRKKKEQEERRRIKKKMEREEEERMRNEKEKEEEDRRMEKKKEKEKKKREEEEEERRRKKREDEEKRKRKKEEEKREEGEKKEEEEEPKKKQKAWRQNTDAKRPKKFRWKRLPMQKREQQEPTRAPPFQPTSILQRVPPHLILGGDGNPMSPPRQQIVVTAPPPCDTPQRDEEQSLKGEPQDAPLAPQVQHTPAELAAFVQATMASLPSAMQALHYQLAAETATKILTGGKPLPHFHQEMDEKTGTLTLHAHEKAWRTALTHALYEAVIVKNHYCGQKDCTHCDYATSHTVAWLREHHGQDCNMPLVCTCFKCQALYLEENIVSDIVHSAPYLRMLVVHAGDTQFFFQDFARFY